MLRAPRLPVQLSEEGRLIRVAVAALTAILATLVAVSAATAGGPGMTIGAVEDAAKWGDPVAKMSLARQAGFRAVRMTMQWSSGQTAPSAGEVQDTGNAAEAARAAGVEARACHLDTGSCPGHPRGVLPWA